MPKKKPLSSSSKKYWLALAKPLLTLTKEQKEEMWKDCYVKCERMKLPKKKHKCLFDKCSLWTKCPGKDCHALKEDKKWCQCGKKKP